MDPEGRALPRQPGRTPPAPLARAPCHNPLVRACSGPRYLRHLMLKSGQARRPHHEAIDVHRGMDHWHPARAGGRWQDGGSVPSTGISSATVHVWKAKFGVCRAGFAGGLTADEAGQPRCVGQNSVNLSTIWIDLPATTLGRDCLPVVKLNDTSFKLHRRGNAALERGM